MLAEPFWGAGQDYHLTGGQAALGHATVAQSGVWSAFYNPGGLDWSGATGISAGVFYDNRFALTDLSIGGVAVSYGFENGGTLGVTTVRYGNTVFNEQTTGLAYSRVLGEKVSAGVKLNFHSLRVGNGYGNATTLSGDIGFLYQMTDNLTLAGALFNPTRSQFVEIGDERLPIVLKGGARYRFSDAVQLSGEVWKELNEAPQLRAGLQYQPVDRVVLMAGVGSAPALTSFGVGYLAGDFRLDLAAAYHNQLGFAPQLTLSYAPVR